MTVYHSHIIFVNKFLVSSNMFLLFHFWARSINQPNICIWTGLYSYVELDNWFYKLGESFGIDGSLTGQIYFLMWWIPPPYHVHLKQTYSKLKMNKGT